jgi:hypothetical protein
VSLASPPQTPPIQRSVSERRRSAEPVRITRAGSGNASGSSTLAFAFSYSASVIAPLSRRAERRSSSSIIAMASPVAERMPQGIIG